MQKPQTPQLLTNEKGFTLFEMIIVIIIIGLISAFLTINYITATTRGRDVQRKSDVKQIRTAIEVYRIDHGYYPSTIYQGNCSQTSSLTDDTPPLNVTPVVYMQKIPCDPSGSNYYNAGKYYYNPSPAPPSQPDSYTLTSCLENSKDSQGTSTTENPNRETGTPECKTSHYYKLSNAP
ncbi:prepilin-type N-terminal cleavage/methylation domain-containing protein [Candidatus Parcubacteria bacterium]|nr:MAG: prepilin-type N-terminal cleavage/methylation domain-containing protein [Candidatus Parcubacteria bacterium]